MFVVTLFNSNIYIIGHAINYARLLEYSIKLIHLMSNVTTFLLTVGIVHN